MKNPVIFNYTNYLSSLIPVENIKLFKDEISFIIDPQLLLNTVEFLKLHTQSQYKILTCISGVDYPEYSKRFEVVYELISIVYNHRLRLKTQVDELTCLPSLTTIFPCANWWEREIWDLFGVFFFNHPDLRRILTDYGFEGYPLRKCFPLTGYIEVRYSKNQERVICEPIKQFSQEFRHFNFSSPWNISN
jgi:NADH dehydrogenase (ubiquinone) Fe-S protein 3